MTETTKKADARSGLSWGPDLRSPLVLGLAGLLIAQLVFAAIATWQEPGLAPPSAQTPLFSFTPDQVSKIRIDGDQGKGGVTLTKSADGNWVLPDLSNFPADAMKVSELLKQVADLKHPMPIATTEAARKRFKVTDDGFERRLTLDGKSGPVATLLIGETPGYRRVFARPAKDPAVYDLSLSMADISARQDDWLDNGLLRVDQDKIQRIAGKGWTIKKDKDGWVLDGSDKKVEQSVANEVAMRVANLGYRGVLGTEDKPADKQQKPVLELSVGTADGKTHSYRISKADKSEDYVLKDADRPYDFRLSKYDLEGLLDVDLDTLTGKKAEAEQKAQAAEKPSDANPAKGAATLDVTAEPQPKAAAEEQPQDAVKHSKAEPEQEAVEAAPKVPAKDEVEPKPASPATEAPPAETQQPESAEMPAAAEPPASQADVETKAAPGTTPATAAPTASTEAKP